MVVPFVDLQSQYQSMKGEIDEAIAEVVQRSAFVGGPFVSQFEDHFAAYCRAKSCIGVANGTDALELALRALHIGAGDEVITAANSFIATSEAITSVGARVVFVDVDPRSYTINVSKIEERITSKTKAIIPVHLYGQPADMDSVNALAHQHNLKVIEDAAQAHGAEYNGQSVGTLGDVACFSFYPGKNLGAYGDAGAVVTDDEDLAKRIRMLANHGRRQKYNHEIEGRNSRLDGMQAAVLDIKLKHLDQWNAARRENAKRYHALLTSTTVSLPEEMKYAKHVYHLYVIRTKSRDGLQAYLKKHGIATGIHYPIALPRLTAYAYLGHKNGDFPVAEQYMDEMLSMPMFPELTEEQIRFTAEKINEFKS